MEYEVNSEEELASVAIELLKNFGNKKIVLFYGEMGVGKTTLIKNLCRQLEIDEATNSPTFSIVNEYLSNSNETVYHFDFYRIENEIEVMDMGYQDYFYSGNFCFIEWPEKIPNLLPDNVIRVKLVLQDDNSRLISVVR